MNGLLICSGTSRSKNIGDYIQSIAQEQFWEHVDRYVERETLDTIESEEKINLIMNGWYMWEPKNFPPSECINPLFISIHINAKIEDEFFRPEVIDYLKRHEPIGARDKGTQRMLERHGIKSYFSACLTLTLGMNYKTDVKNDKILFVDPYIYKKGTKTDIAKSLFKASLYLLRHPLKTHRLTKKIDYNITRISWYCKTLDRYLGMAYFYHVYHKLFDDEFLFNAEYISHEVNNDVTDDEKMEQARQLVRLYAGAKLVVTSRIHAALPCLGVETPVIFIPSQGLDATRENAGRFDGLLDFFHTITWTNDQLIINSQEIKDQLRNGKIIQDIQITNKSTFKDYRDSLSKTVSEWIKGLENYPPHLMKM